MCLGGHLAYRCALDSRVKAAVCYFATDIHSKTLAAGKNDDSLARTGDIKGELLMVCALSLVLLLFVFFFFIIYCLFPWLFYSPRSTCSISASEQPRLYIQSM